MITFLYRPPHGWNTSKELGYRKTYCSLVNPGGTSSFLAEVRMTMSVMALVSSSSGLSFTTSCQELKALLSAGGREGGRKGILCF